MAINLQVEQELDTIGQSVKDQNGKTSQLALSTDGVGIGTTAPEAKLEVKGEVRVTDGSLTVSHPTGQGASLHVGWKDDIPRIRIGGGDAAARNGLDIQTRRDRSLMRITDSGAVGIGTTAPEAKLEVKGEVRVTDGNLTVSHPTGQGASLHVGWKDDIPRIRIGGGGAAARNGLDIQTRRDRSLMRITDNGNIIIPGDILLSGADCAEDFDVEENQPLSPGTVMVIGDENRLRQCTEAFDKKVAGILSGAGDCKPGIILDRQQSKNRRMPLALSGKAFCKVDAQYSPIEVGDLLTTSCTPGYAMKVDDPLQAFGAVIGKALCSLSEGQGLIPVLIALH